MKKLILILAFTMAGCAPEPDQDDDSVLLDAAKNPIDKAEAVEDTLLDAKEQRDKAIEDAED